MTVCGKTVEEHNKNLERVNELSKKYNITFNEKKNIVCATSITLVGYTVSHNKITPDYNRLKPLLEMPPPSNLKSQKCIIGMFAYYSKFIKNFSDKIYQLNHNDIFPLPPAVLNSFQKLKEDLKDAMFVTVDYDEDVKVETDASDYSIAATLNQQGRPVAFFSRTLQNSEIKHHAVEKEAAAIVEAL